MWFAAVVSTPSRHRIFQDSRNSFQWARTCGWAAGNRTMAAISQRQKAIATGGASKRRPLAMTQLPAHASAARESSRYGAFHTLLGFGGSGPLSNGEGIAE